MICKAKKALKIGSKVYPKNSLLNLPEDKAQILLNKNLIQPVTYEELHQALTEELKEDNKINNSKGLLVKLNILDDEVALTTPGYLEEVKKQGFVTYLPEEIISLPVAKPKLLQLIHEIKKVFDGRIKSAPAEDMKRKWQ
ncbi:MAG: hypothetical protein B5M53_08135 [Candidatus Cloacimonas sp. 4484_209]|nr:MAG: hypothetical protein B5M53_08135 [Candidatus Cloacimonas sp. 4484_209]